MNSTLCGEELVAGSPIPYSVQIILIAFLICQSALFSGLTLGLLGLDKVGLQIIIAGDDAELAEYVFCLLYYFARDYIIIILLLWWWWGDRCARIIQPLREDGNLLLCVLLLGNVATNSLLSILMADMTSGMVGFLTSTILIVMFGEIIPQATCSRYCILH